MNKELNRRDFLKVVGQACICLCLFRFKELSEVLLDKNNSIPMKEAKYYSRADHLAG